MKEFWFAKKSVVTALIIFAIVLFLVIYQYPVLGVFDSATLTAGIPTFILYIWLVNVLYIVITAGIVVWIFRNAQEIQWKETPKEG
ncbi:MAG: hypothetical protein HXS46_14775 [Theionarchaea archaeon]|nr:MAG: hypothetical protein AYK18_11915 [Theionarchaea archaeon DG-70]MBU7011946.1 hypothetical protein [Theionarchaea archaeon]